MAVTRAIKAEVYRGTRNSSGIGMSMSMDMGMDIETGISLEVVQ
nr:hypothetical protein [Paenibacillus xylanexedens]